MRIHAEAKPLTEPLRGGTKGATVTVEPLSGGELQAPAAFVERTGGRMEALRMLGVGTPRSEWRWFPCPAFLILSLIHISEPTRLRRISYAVFCLKKKKTQKRKKKPLYNNHKKQSKKKQNNITT